MCHGNHAEFTLHNKEFKNKLPAIPQAVRAETLTLQSTLVGKKSIFMKIRIRSESCDQQIYILR